MFRSGGSCPSVHSVFIASIIVNYLVTGCAGFIGSKVVIQLLNAGHQVLGIDDLNNYYDTDLKHHRLYDLLSRPNFSFQQFGIENRTRVEALFAKHDFDAVINLAAAVGVRYSLENPHVYMTTNCVGNLNLLESIRQTGVPKYVLASTSSLYAGQEMPFLETLPVNTPISPYAASKKSAEATSWTYHHLFDIDVSIVRYFTVYGPAGRPDMGIFRFIKWIAEKEPIQLYGNGDQSRDFTFVDDIANGTVKALKPVGHEIINLGGGNRPATLNQVIEIVAKQLGREPTVKFREAHDADMRSTWADISKAKRLLNWEPLVTLEQGLQQCVDWYLENRQWARDLDLCNPSIHASMPRLVG